MRQNITYKYIINPKLGLSTQADSTSSNKNEGGEHLSDWIHRLPSEYDTTGRLIYDKRNKVRIFTVEGQTLVAKRFKQPMLHQRIDYTCIRPSKAKRAYLFALRLQELGISTPEPIACIEEYHNGLFFQGYFVSAYCGDPDCRLLRDGLKGNEQLIHSLAQFIVEMHEKGFMHGDINLSNILYHISEDGTYHFSVIDINRSHFVSNPTRRQCLRNLVRLTHVRTTMEAIVKEYAGIRQWDATQCINEMMTLLDDFEAPKCSIRAIRRMFR